MKRLLLLLLLSFVVISCGKPGYPRAMAGERPAIFHLEYEQGNPKNNSNKVNIEGNFYYSDLDNDVNKVLVEYDKNVLKIIPLILINTHTTGVIYFDFDVEIEKNEIIHFYITAIDKKGNASNRLKGIINSKNGI